MPIYEFFCIDCREKFEALLNVGEIAKSCPTCKGPNIEKKFSVFGFASKSSAGDIASSSSSKSGCASCSSSNCASCKH